MAHTLIIGALSISFRAGIRERAVKLKKQRVLAHLETVVF